MLHRKDYKWIRKWIALSLCMGFSLSGCGKQAETVTDYGTTSDTGENTSGSSARTEEKPELKRILVTPLTFHPMTGERYPSSWAVRSSPMKRIFLSVRCRQ